MAAIRSPINIISLNCKGIKGNLDYVEHLLQNECDLMFVCEHWLKPCDLYQMNSHFREQSYWCNPKSSVPADEVLAGRPYGDVGFVCRKREHCTIKNVPHADNRISVIQIINNSADRIKTDIFSISLKHEIHLLLYCRLHRAVLQLVLC